MKECTYSMRKSCKIWSACSEAYSGGEDLPPCTKESQTTDTQQLKAEIRAMCIELECTTHDKFDSGMYHALRGRLRELSAV